MAELMGDPRDPDAQDGTHTAVDDAFDLVLETAPVDTSAAVGGDCGREQTACPICRVPVKAVLEIFL